MLACQSKIVLREPVYYGFHRDRLWYPRRPTDPDQVLSDFRAFVAGLAAGFEADSTMRDPHWGRQSEVVDELELTPVGRAEKLAATYDLLADHVSSTRKAVLRADQTKTRARLG